MEFPPKDQGRGVFQYEDLTHNRAVPIPLDQELSDDLTWPSPVTPPNGPASQLGQPDSEPGQNPTSDNLSGYSPTPPIATPARSENLHEAQHPAVNPPEIESAELPNIPIPDDSDEGLIAEDYWIHQGSQLIRAHCQA